MYDWEIQLMDGRVWSNFGYHELKDALHDVGVTIEDYPNLFFERIEIVYHSYNEESDTQTEGEDNER